MNKFSEIWQIGSTLLEQCYYPLVGVTMGMHFILAAPTESCFHCQNQCCFHKSVRKLYRVFLINEISVNNPNLLHKFITVEGWRLTENCPWGVFFFCCYSQVESISIEIIIWRRD